MTFSTSFRNVEADLSQAADRLSRAQQEVSSGRRVRSSSDDPAATSEAIRERSAIATLDHYVKASNTVESSLTVADTALSDLIDRLTAARSTSLGAQGTAVTASKREAAAVQMEAIRDAILTDVNVRFGDRYLFAGSAVTTPPYQRNPDGTISGYQGDLAPLLVDVDGQTAVPLTLAGDAVLRGAEADDVFVVLDGLAQAVRGGDQEAISDGLDALERAFTRVSQAQSRVGAHLQALDDQQTRLDAMRRASSARVSTLEDANMVEAITRLNQSETAYQAALGAASHVTQLSLLDFLK